MSEGRLELIEVETFVWQSTTEANIVLPMQTHSTNVIEVETGNESLIHCDGLITKNKSLVLGVKTADCAAICCTDGERIAIVHAGWRGLCGGIIEEMLSKMLEPKEIFVGPLLHSFEIQKDHCYEAITTKFGKRFLDERDGNIYFRFKDAVASCLPTLAIFDERDTETALELPSHRHNRPGRMVTTVSFPE